MLCLVSNRAPPRLYTLAETIENNLLFLEVNLYTKARRHSLFSIVMHFKYHLQWKNRPLPSHSTNGNIFNTWYYHSVRRDQFAEKIPRPPQIQWQTHQQDPPHNVNESATLQQENVP